jgi:hypothetical protein
LFIGIGGFDVNYKTGEDVKLCDDARSADARIIMNNKIQVFHHGYPKTIGEFFKRERWHGLGMGKSLAKPWRSRPLLLALYYIICLIFWIIGIFSWFDSFAFSFLFFLFVTILPVSILAAQRSMKNIEKCLELTFLYFIYGWARALSLIDISLNYCKSIFKPK